MRAARCAYMLVVAACVGDEAKLIEDLPSCPPGLTACAGSCVDTALDPRHCGACEEPCPDGLLCSIGQCAVECLGGTKQCGDVCVDINVDPNNCGDCDTRCMPNQACQQGSCGTPASCLDVLSSGTSLGDGVYTIDPTGGDASDARLVYCDMTTDGGGWTLVGRSAAGPAAPGCAPDAGVLVEGTAFESTSAPPSPCTAATPAGPLALNCANGCAVLCSVGHLDYTVPTQIGKSYTVTLKIADYLHDCLNPVSAHVEAGGAIIGTWQSSGTNAWAFPAFTFTATTATTLISVAQDNDFCCECNMTCNPSCTPLVGDANIYLDHLVVTPAIASPFGWSGAAGALDDDLAAYSLGVLNLPLSEILFGDYAQGKAWGDRVYKLPVGSDFLATHAMDAFAAGAASSVSGGCPDGPTQLSWVGFTADTDAFHINGDGSNGFGLTPLGWRTCYDDCAQGGELNGKPGMIFAR